MYVSCVQVKAVLEEGMKIPKEHIKKFEKYQSLISREVQLMDVHMLNKLTECGWLTVSG